jgi:hypothetical protein
MARGLLECCSHSSCPLECSVGSDVTAAKTVVHLCDTLHAHGLLPSPAGCLFLFQFRCMQPTQSGIRLLHVVVKVQQSSVCRSSHSPCLVNIPMVLAE